MVRAVLAGLAVGVVTLAGTTEVAPPASARAAGPCHALPSLSTAARDSRPGGSVVVQRWTGRQVDGSRLDVTVAAARVDSRTRLVALNAPVGRAVSTSALLAARRGTVVAVNGGFFGVSGALSFSAGVQVHGGRAQRVPSGATPVVGTDAAGRVRLGTARASGRVTFRGRRTTSVPVVAVDARPVGRGVAVFDRGWPSGTPRSGGAWEVLVRRGKVTVSARSVHVDVSRLPAAERAFVLRAASGDEASLRRVAVGSRVELRVGVVDERGTPLTEAVGRGNVQVLAGRIVEHGCGQQDLRPRTLVATDATRTRVWLAVATASTAAGTDVYRGATPHQMAELALRLGATEAVLVDGGGSTTLVVRSGPTTRRLDRSAGGSQTQRAVPDGLGLSATG